MVVNFKIGLLTLVTGFKFMIHGIIPAFFKKLIKTIVKICKNNSRNFVN